MVAGARTRAAALGGQHGRGQTLLAHILAHRNRFRRDQPLPLYRARRKSSSVMGGTSPESHAGSGGCSDAPVKDSVAAALTRIEAEHASSKRTCCTPPPGNIAYGNTLAGSGVTQPTRTVLGRSRAVQASGSLARGYKSTAGSGPMWRRTAFARGIQPPFG